MFNNFFEYIFAHQREAERERTRDQWGITNENGYDGVDKIGIPHEYNEITIKNKNYYCERNKILTVYNYGGRKLFTSNDIRNYGGDMYLVKIIDEEIITEEWGYALFCDGEKLTDDIFKPEGRFNNEFNKNGLTILNLADEKDYKVVVNRKGEIIHKEESGYFDKLYLYGVVLHTKKGYLNLLNNQYICGESYRSNDTIDNGECLFIKTEENCIYQINMNNGEFLLHGKEKEKEKPFTEEELKKHQEKIAASQKLLSERTEESALWNKLGRNDPCKCGSGEKFKKCCIKNWKKDVRDKYTMEA